jgi:tetratricopeptide (TPR) repeat protein
MIGVWKEECPSFLHSSIPLMPGKRRSAMMSSGGASERHFVSGLSVTRNHRNVLFFLQHDRQCFAQSLKKAEDLDPLSLIIGADLAEDLLLAHRYDEAIRQTQKTMDMDPNFALAHYQLGQVFLQKHRYNEAIAELQAAVRLSGGSTTCNIRPCLCGAL